MTRSPLITRWGQAWLGMLFLTLSTLSASAASPKRVLILDAFGHEVAPFNVSLSAFRTTLTREFGAPLEFYEISLDRARFPEPAGPDPFVEFLESRITNRPMDLVATFGGPGMDFVLRHHERFFPDTPIVFMAGPPQLSRTGSLKGKAAQVTHTLNFAGMVEDILQLQPQTTNIVVVIGASPLETVTMNNCRREFQSFTNRVAFTWLNDLPLEQVLKRCATLPPRSFILYALFLVDVAGTPFDQDEPLRRLHTVANAPVFGSCVSELGLGPIGGRLYQDSEIGVQAARTAIRILRGESPGSIPVLELKATTPLYDWRELRRWSISESRLPPGSIVQYRQLTFWEQYRWSVVGVLVFCGLQTALIIGLIVNRAKRRQGEAALRESEHRMKLAADAAQLGMWIWDIPKNQVWASEKCKELFGYPAGVDITHEAIAARVHPEDREKRELAIQRALKETGTYHVEFRSVLPDGSMCWIASKGRVERDAGGQPRRLMGIAIDITDRRQAEDSARDLGGRLINAQDDERSRIARDLHDDLNQRLALLSVELDILRRTTSDKGECTTALDLMGEQVKDMSSDVHKLAYQLHPAKLYQLGLVAAGRSLCRELARQSGSAIDFVAENVPGEIPPHVALCCYRVLQEALGNVVRHSGAKAVRVDLRADARYLQLVVADTGQGFDVEAARRTGGLGLVSMRERARLLHGKFEIHSAPGKGTQVELSLPLPAPVPGGAGVETGHPA